MRPLSLLAQRVSLTGLGGRVEALRRRLYPRRVVFVHVPKSGGTSLSHVLRAHFALSQFKLDEEASQDVGEALGLGEWMRFKRRLMAYQIAAGARFVQAHAPVDAPLLDRWAAEAHFITLLRDPVERLVSAYHFDPRLSRMGPEAFLDSPQCATEARVLSHFFGELDWDAPRNFEAAIGRAVENLSRFSVVGFLDNEAAFRRALARRVGVRMRLPKRNVGAREGFAPFDAEGQARMRALAAPDIEIWRRLRAAASARPEG